MASFFQNIGENIMKFVSTIQWYDILDIIVVALVFYYCIKLFTRTRAIHLVRGFVFLGLVYFIVSALNMSTSSFLFSRLFSDIVLVIVLLFQPEFRHAIESFGRGDFAKFNLFSSYSSLMREETQQSISALVKAVMTMSDGKVGALIVLEGKSPLGEIIATGSEIDAKISEPIVENIFYPKSPLHDGAMVIRNNRITAAGCILPLTQNELSRELGTRHRAAVGMSEVSDALVIVVSEETGAVSAAQNATLKRGLASGELLELLNAFLFSDEEKSVKRPRRKRHEK
ncbi:MAG: diadenylate cyclase CdaA [Clostridia bacterium]|nr:diadenylate cyclase CdaA [Clostridia bacterium]